MKKFTAEDVENKMRDLKFFKGYNNLSEIVHANKNRVIREILSSYLKPSLSSDDGSPILYDFNRYMDTKLTEKNTLRVTLKEEYPVKFFTSKCISPFIINIELALGMNGSVFYKAVFVDKDGDESKQSFNQTVTLNEERLNQLIDEKEKSGYSRNIRVLDVVDDILIDWFKESIDLLLQPVNKAVELFVSDLMERRLI